MKCPKQELLSVYVDGEATPLECRWLETHLGQCPACLRSARFLNALKVQLANFPVPGMPQDLTESLRKIVPEQIPDAMPVRMPLWERISRQIYTWGACAAIAMACVFWIQSNREAPQDIPVEWLLAEHRRDVAKLPLAEAERALPEEPPEDIPHGL